MRDQHLCLILLFLIKGGSCLTPYADNIVKSYVDTNWICTTRVPQFCLKNKVVNPIEFDKMMGACSNKNMLWDESAPTNLVNGVSLFTVMVTKDELVKCTKSFQNFLLTQLVIDDYNKYLNSIVVSTKEPDDFITTISNMKVDFSHSGIGKVGPISVSYDVARSTPGRIGQSVCGNADLKSWSLTDADCKFSICGNIHIGMDGKYHMLTDYPGDSTSISVSFGLWTIGVSFSISDSKLVLRKPTIQICWDVWSLNWFKVLAQFLDSGKMGAMIKKIFQAIFENRDNINKLATVSDQKKLLQDILKMSNAGANVCKAKLYTPEELWDENKNKIMRLDESLSSGVLNLIDLAVKTFRSSLSRVSPNKMKKAKSLNPVVVT